MPAPSSAVRLAAAFLVVLALTAAAQGPDRSVPAIRVNQAGYLPHAVKIAIVAGSDSPATATVRETRSGRTVLKLPISAPSTDALTNDVVRTIDFTRLRTPGTYVIEAAGLGASDPVRVDPEAYHRALYLAIRSYYGQRCGTAVDLGPEFPGFRHAACHLDDAEFHPASGRSGRIKATGGWHDAGDYGKYIVNSGIATGQLLWAWEWYPERLRGLRLDIPESANATPDLLDEIRWNLDWMLTMQDTDGGVWQKLTSARFGSFTMPERDDAGTRYVIGTGTDPYKSSCATADFAAVTAIASRVFDPFDREYAARTIDASRRAFAWLTAHPDVLFRNPPGISTGEYGDRDCTDERLWAAAELYRTTGERPFGDVARELAAQFHVSASTPQSWNHVGNMGLWAYAWATAKDADAGVQRRVAAETMAAAETVAARTSAPGWRHSLERADLVWGSNGVVANYGVLLLAADRFAGAPRFVEAARDDLHYLLGRNTFGVSWVTGVGVRPFQHPHHRPSGADGNDAPWPGLLSGGPNARAGDPELAKVPADPPGRRYLDSEPAYSANEVAINWNSALVVLLAGAQGE